MDGMERIEVVRRHPLFQQEYGRLWAAEVDRIYCCHSMVHLLDVARLLYIRRLEDGVDLPRDVVYAAALLHDIGRHAQMEDGTPHDIAGAELAGTILRDCGYSPEETEAIQRAILSHRQPGAGEWLCRHLYWADKASRACYDCPARPSCNWPDEKKNLELSY